jgi:hypothetical protein
MSDVERELRRLFERLAEEVEENSAADGEFRGRLDASRGRRRVGEQHLIAAVIAAMILIVAVPVLVLTSLRQGSEEGPTSPQSPTAPVQRQIELHATGAQLSTGQGAVWALSQTGRLLRVDPVSGDVTGTFAVPGETAGDRLVAGLGFVWLARAGGDPAILQIDASDGSVRRETAVARPGSVALDIGAVWAQTGDRTVSRLEPSSAAPSHPLHLPVAPDILVASGGYLWAAARGDHEAFRIAESTGRSVSVTLAGGITGLTIAGSHVWASTSSGVTAIDPATARIAAGIPIGDVRSVVADHASHEVWALSGDRTLTRVDDTHLRESATWTIPGDGPVAGIGVGFGSVWALDGQLLFQLAPTP